jgi:hypothetical protein
LFLGYINCRKRGAGLSNFSERKNGCVSEFTESNLWFRIRGFEI